MARPDPLAHLSRHSELSPALIREVRGLGASAVPRLLTILLDPGALVEGSPGERAAGNAPQFLVEHQTDEVRAAFWEVFTTDPVESVRFDQVSHCLRRFGLPMLEPLLEMAGGDSEKWIDAAEVLGHLGVKDPRIVPVLRRLIGEWGGLASEAVIMYHDQALLPELRAVFDARVNAVEIDRDAAEDLVNLLDAILRLGGEDVPRSAAVVAATGRYAAGAQARIAELREELAEAKERRDELVKRSGKQRR